MTIYGVDVHARYQAGLDIPLLAEQGYSFLVTKASEGTWTPSVTGFTAAQFKARTLDWIGQARAAGMIPGLYHWIKGGGTAAAQARFFHAIVAEAGGAEGMLIQLDCEDDATYTDVTAWAQEWERLTGGHPFLLYTGGWWWRPRGWDGLAITPYLWDSHYLTADVDTLADDPAGFAARIPATWWEPQYGRWPRATILQFTSKGDAGSLGNKVDLNATKLTRDELLALTTTGADMPLTDDDIRRILGADVSTITNQRSLASALWFARNNALAANQRLAGLADIPDLDAMTARLDLILAAALDDGDVSVTMPPEYAAELQALRDALTGELRDAVADLGEGGASQVRTDAPEG